MIIASSQQPAESQRAFGELKYWLTDLAVSFQNESEDNADAAGERLGKALKSLAKIDADKTAAIEKQVEQVKERSLEAVDAYVDKNRVLGNSLLAKARESIRAVDKALDEIAERVRALGVFAPTSGKQFAELSAIENADTAPPKAADMIERLLSDHETLIKRARNGLETAEEAGDAASADLLTVRIQTHEKTAWMLRALTQ